MGPEGRDEAVMRKPQAACTALLISFLVVAAPLGAYTIYLKDGSRIIAREAHKIEEGKALIVLQNGTQTFIDAAEIDLERTAEANRANYGTALILEDGEFKEAPTEYVAPREETLTDIARPGSRPEPRARRPAEDSQAPI